MELRGLGPTDYNRTIWRYMSFPKFISLITYQALWFSKLNILQDQYEGLIPAPTKARMHEENQKYKAHFNTPEFHRQIDSWLTDNEESGRELLVVTCWFLGDTDSKQMWDEYGASAESVAVKTTIGRLAQSVFVPRDKSVSQLGLVSYVTHESHEMNSYEANQAIERAFLKDKDRFSHEQEVRLATLSVKTTTCVAPNGHPYTADQVAGAGMNNFESPGLYVGADLNRLIAEVVVCPTAQDWFFMLIRRIVEISGLSAAVTHSPPQNA